MNGNVTMAANSHLAIDLNAVADKLVVNGNLDLSNVDYLDLGSSGSGLSWVIASYTGVLTGTFNHITLVYSGFGPFETTVIYCELRDGQQQSNYLDGRTNRSER